MKITSEDKNGFRNIVVLLCWLVFLIFLVLKLCKVIDWPWWLITFPLWVSTAIFLFLTILSGMFLIGKWYFKRRK